MIDEQLLKAIDDSESIEALCFNELMPEPFNDDGFYFVYFSDTDYKIALKDIVELCEHSVRIWYDRRRESGQAWEASMLAKTRSIYCLCVVFYISSSTFSSTFFWQLAEYVAAYNLPYCPIMIADDDDVKDGYSIIKDADNFTERQKQLIKRLFSQDITYVSANTTVEAKQQALSNINVNHALLYDIVGDEAIVIGVKDLSVHRIAVPEQIRIAGKIYPVTGVAYNSFYHCRYLKEVKFPDTVTRIGFDYDEPATKDSLVGQMFNFIVNKMGQEDNYVFYNCPKLTCIVLPPHVKTVNRLFSKCKNLGALIIGPEVEELFLDEGFGGDLLGDDLPKLSYLRLPPSVIYVEDSGKYFRKAKDGSWYELSIPEGVEQVKGYTSYKTPKHLKVECGENYDNLLRFSTALESVEFDEKFSNAVGDWFSYCDNLTSVIFSDGIEELGHTFQFCSCITDVKLPKNLKKMDGTFWYCDGLTQISLPENLLEMNNVFAKCTSLESIDLPQCLRTISGSCFEGCEALTQIRIPSNVCHISEHAFVGCENLKSITIDSTHRELFNWHATWRFELDRIRQKKRHFWLPIILRARLLFCKIFRPNVYKRSFSPFYLFMNAETIFLKKKMKLKKYKRIKSDRAGYYKYIPRKNYTSIKMPAYDE